jgi:uncharacterized membrane protein
MNQTKKHLIATSILRYGFAAVFLWFGIMEIFNPGAWVGFIPKWITAFSAHSFVLVNGAVEIIFGVALAFDFYVSIVATLLALHLLLIIIEVGLGAIGIRDVGLMFALFALAVLAFKED